MAESDIKLNNHGTTIDAIPQASTFPLPSSGNQQIRNGVESSSSLQTGNATRSISESSTGSQPATKKSPSDFIFGKSIGEGSFSTVYLAKDAETHREYARLIQKLATEIGLQFIEQRNPSIKVCNKRHIIREKKSKYVKQERDILQRLSGSPFIVKLFCTFQCTERLYFVLTLARNGELHTLIQKMGKLDFNLARFFTCQLLQALEAMKRHKILHRDLKPENILLDEKMNVLVTDFGSAKFMDVEETLMNNIEAYKQTNSPSDRASSSSDDERHEPTQNGDADDSDELDAYVLEDSDDDSSRPFLGRLRSFVGTANFLSPEIVKFKKFPVTYACDLWAFACVVYQMLTGKLLFAGTNDFMIFKRIIHLKYKVPDDFPDSAKDFIKRFLVIDPYKRLGARDGDQYDSIRNHRFFDGVDWKCLGSAPIDKTVAKSSTIQDEDCFKSAQPGFDERQLARLLGLLDNKDVIELPVVHLPQTPLHNPRRNIADVPEMERESRLEEQRGNQVINDIVDGYLILKQGILEKKHNTISISRKKLFFITLGPKIFYTDPETLTKKKEIVWTRELKVESRNFKQFLIHTPQRVYRLECPASTAPEWKEVIEEVHAFYFSTKQEETSQPGSQ